MYSSGPESLPEEEWIRKNIKQRKCVIFGKFSNDHPERCKCNKDRGSHRSEEHSGSWSRSKNTETESCKHFGVLTFDSGTTSKYVRIDVDTNTSTTEELLLEKWKLPKPNWIISAIGDAQSIVKSKELQAQIRNVAVSISEGQNIWVTTEGINYGLSEIIGNALKNELEPSSDGSVTLLGINGWGVLDEEFLQLLEQKECLLENKERVNPSGFYPYQLFVDDGTRMHPDSLTTYQAFRMRLAKSLTKFSDESSSLPFVHVLYSGWADVIDVLLESVQNSIPIVVLQNTGGFADVISHLFDVSKEDIIHRSTSENGKTWTGTVIDDSLRKAVEDGYEKVHEERDKAGQHKLLQCLQKRELLTFVDIDGEDEYALLKAIITALMKAQSFQATLRSIDCYMPSRLFDEEGTFMSTFMQYYQGYQDIMSLFLEQAMHLDQSEYVQFIIDYEGVDLSDFVEENLKLLKVADVKAEDKNPPTVNHQESQDSDEMMGNHEEYKVLLTWAVRSRKPKCAAFFWKKGKDLLASSLEMVLSLRDEMKKEKSIGKRKSLEENALLFQKRAIGLLDHCYEDNVDDTMKMIQLQAEGNIWNKNMLEKCFTKSNRRIHASEAFKKYIEHVWFGKINPPKMETFKKSMIQDNLEKTPKISSLIVAPLSTYILNLFFHICFLCLFAHTLLFELGEKEHNAILEGILVFWWLSFVVEEGRQFWSTPIHQEDNTCDKLIKGFGIKSRGYFFGNYWNVLDSICLGFFLIGAILLAVYHTDNTQTGVYQAARMFLSLDLMFYTWRLLQHFSVSKTLGPLLEMIFKMLQDLIPFLLIMCVFIVSQGLASFALLYPNRNWTPEVFLDIPKRSFWNIFGELGLEAIEANETDCTSLQASENYNIDDCPSTLGKYAVPFLLAMYMLMMNVLLLNLLIAKFSYTFQHIHVQTEWLSAWQRARVTFEYYQKPPLPPPFNIFFHIIQQLYQCMCPKNKVGIERERKTPEDLEERRRIEGWERSMAECYLASAECKSGSERMSIIEKKETYQEHIKTVSESKQRDKEDVSTEIVKTAGHDVDVLEELNTRLKNIEKDLKKTLKQQRKMKHVLDDVVLVSRGSKQNNSDVDETGNI